MASVHCSAHSYYRLAYRATRCLVAPLGTENRRARTVRGPYYHIRIFRHHITSCCSSKLMRTVYRLKVYNDSPILGSHNCPGTPYSTAGDGA